ncbi:chromosome segregation protein SMC [Gallaecimonas xiamenensis]|uniref:Chromosome partition protein Smc n=1 Tax=Gallaecimonas xiamenensis 3-C-1 TaxID=745411 RepID=K2J1L4_9GAMM|nr:chromosome segregation protein SMC [Gallaecimonas xiamenensis]EKE68672.1 chromosome segregation protein SMC [Gallaecimonas xiamenensis 3-C-1]
MRLKSIKLAGFKSFVDATTVPFPRAMTAVVGPNGCGKSNIIDAVRWVLGESSAKNLRGDAMTDVIFNGSSGRKPVSQASVELVFDNSDGTATGPVAQYAEIAVKRLVTRDGQSQYFMNGSRCRRRDITDIFLGTGLGPRSYAIIEQGMISRLIESRPQELRVFIEEAAGISKYKERRKETENRIRHTRDNLERLTDVREELGQQLDKLRRQADAARRYRDYKHQERTAKGQLAALRYRRYQDAITSLNGEIRHFETELERFIAQSRGDEKAMVALKETQHDAKGQIEQAQSRYYRLGSEIARAEQNLANAKSRKAQLDEQLARLQQRAEQARLTLSEDQQRQQEADEELEMLTPELDEYQEQLAEARLNREGLENQHRAQQQALAARLQRQGQLQTRLQVLATRIDNLGANIQRDHQRLAGFVGQDDDALLAVKEQLAEQQALAEEHQEALALAEMDHQQGQSDLKAAREQLKTQTEVHRQAERALDTQQSRIQQLSALIDAAAPKESVAGLDELPALLAQLQVQAPWHQAVEQVLGSWLQARVGDYGPFLDVTQPALLVRPGAHQPSPASLGAQVQSPVPLPWLDRVRTAPDREAAKALGASLGPGESVICPDGFWLGADFLATAPAAGQGLSLVADLEALQGQLPALQQELDQASGQLAQAEAALAQAEQQLQQLASQQQQAQQRQQESRQQLAILQARAGDLDAQAKARQQERAQLQEAIADQELEQAELMEERLMLEEEAEQGDEHQPVDDLEPQLQDARALEEQLRGQAQQLQIRFETLKSRRQSLAESCQRAAMQVEEVSEQLEALLEEQQLLDEPGQEQGSQLEIWLEEHKEVEERLTVLNQQMADIDERMALLEDGQAAAFAKVQSMQGEIDRRRVEIEGHKVRSDGAREQLDELEQDIDAVLASLEDQNEEALAKDIDRLVNAIARLGAINLAAIEEFEQQAERKKYLDEQDADLNAALETLENAIRKIDRETRAKFKDTFDVVNADLQRLFPKVFGGGSAYLELTGDDLLDTGVTIMARPPGKRNATIHLLSGGEKALTALSLVFAIFRLNPAPFCMLDEVDAPLDDANVERYCRLVREMSDSVQFIYISHNKVAMEMADQLTGVTMHEPGVSRIVAVDIEQAVALAEAG